MRTSSTSSGVSVFRVRATSATCHTVSHSTLEGASFLMFFFLYSLRYLSKRMESRVCVLVSLMMHTLTVSASLFSVKYPKNSTRQEIVLLTLVSQLCGKSYDSFPRSSSLFLHCLPD